MPLLSKKNIFFHLKTSFFNVKSKIRGFFAHFRGEDVHPNALPMISEQSSLREICFSYPAFADFLHKRFSLSLRRTDLDLSLQFFSQTHSLPPPQILFMLFQLAQRSQSKEISARDLKTWLEDDSNLVVLDVREPWERERGTLPRSHALTEEFLQKEVTQWPKNRPIAVVCHYGIRSLDAAAYLNDLGFEDVRALTGGLEAWSLEADPSFPRYAGHPC